MNAVLWIFIALVFGLMLFVSIQEELPPELAFLKNTAVTTGAPAEAGSPQAQNFNYEGWQVRQSGVTIELVKPLEGRLERDGVVFDTPELGILCHDGKLDLRLDTRLAVTGAKTTPVRFHDVDSPWTKGLNRNIFPADPTTTVRKLAAAQGSVAVTLSYVELGNQTTTLNLRGLPQLMERLPRSCQ